MVNLKMNAVVIVSLSLLAFTGCNKKSKQSGGAPVGAAAPATPAPATPTPDPATPAPAPGTATPAPAMETGDQVPDPSALFQDCTTAKNSKFVADLVRIPTETVKIPNFDDLKVIRQVCLNQLAITPRGFEGGFPGVPEIQEWFALNIKFKLKIDKAGEYKFWLNSDDGAAVYVDGVKMIDNDGRHGPRSKEARINMTSGTHEMNVQYFQGPRTQIALELKWRAPSDTMDVYIPVELLSRP